MKNWIIAVLIIEIVAWIIYLCLPKATKCIREENVNIVPVNIDYSSTLKLVTVYHLSNGFYCYKEGTNVFYLCLGDQLFVSKDSISDAITRDSLLWTQYVEIDAETRQLINLEIERLNRERRDGEIEQFLVSEEIVNVP